MTFDERLMAVVEAESRWHRQYRKQKSRQAKTATQGPPRLPEELRKIIRPELEIIRQSLANLSSYPELQEDITAALDILFPGSATATSEAMAGDPTELKISEFGKVIKSAETILKALGSAREFIHLRKQVVRFRNHMRRTVGRKIVHSPSGTKVIKSEPIPDDPGDTTVGIDTWLGEE